MLDPKGLGESMVVRFAQMAITVRNAMVTRNDALTVRESIRSVLGNTAYNLTKVLPVSVRVELGLTRCKQLELA